ncbi:MAG: ubiquinol-cytochrome c reductase iron-sulfur subunit [Geobacteraceae bacterium]|nr:ubiquinol-cytochrome c reductase iron-sulfur subunit [Geobacteraceae bacterium]
MHGHDFPSAEQTESSRRGFLKLAIGLASAIFGLALGIPLVSSLVGPSLRKKNPHWARVTDIASLETGQPLSLQFSDVTEDAYIHEKVTRTVWVIKLSPNDLTVFSPICPHLGCAFDWQPERGLFVCPCHGSVYTLDGKVVAGPAPRPLDTLPHMIDNGVLYIEWERFQVGTPQKVRV